MWRIDHADQDDYVDDLLLVTSAVDVLQATPISDSTYSFVFEKNAIGRVQLKIFVTCLADKTQGGSHQHRFQTIAGPQGSFFQSDGVTPGFDSQTTPVTGDSSLTVADVDSVSATPCPTGFVLVSPGFEANNFNGSFAGDTIAGMMRLFESDSTASPRDWTWKFENSALPDNTYGMDIVTTWRCLKIKVPQNGFDKHKLVPKWKSPKTFNPSKNNVSEGQYNCGDAYKAIVAGFRIPQNAGDKPSYRKDGEGIFATPQSAFAFNNVWYLGMDPRPKQRAYRFANWSLTNTYPVILTALCLNYRTT
jgi:hypothetical protein